MGGWRGSDDDHGTAGHLDHGGPMRGTYPVPPRPEVFAAVHHPGHWPPAGAGAGLGPGAGPARVPEGLRAFPLGLERRPGAGEPDVAAVPGLDGPALRDEPEPMIRRTVRGVGELLITCGLVV